MIISVAWKVVDRRREIMYALQCEAKRNKNKQKQEKNKGKK